MEAIVVGSLRLKKLIVHSAATTTIFLLSSRRVFRSMRQVAEKLLLRAAVELPFKLRASSVSSTESFLGHSLFSLYHKIHFYFKVSRRGTIGNKCSHRKVQTKAALRALAQVITEPTRFVNDPNLPANESYSVIALRNNAFWKQAISIW